MKGALRILCPLVNVFPQPEADKAFERLWGEQKARLNRKTYERKKARSA